MKTFIGDRAQAQAKMRSSTVGDGVEIHTLTDLWT